MTDDNIVYTKKEMISKLLRTNVLAIRCIGDYILVGMGFTLYVFDKESYQFKSALNSLYPSNIHGIVAGPNNILAVFGAKSICICEIIKKDETIIFKELRNDRFNDWIIAVEWVTMKEQIQLVILFAHNYVTIYDITIFNTSFQVVYCKEKCILYGGSISEISQGDIIIFSGTVFKEILIWKVSNNGIDESSPVLHRLTGHKGVIFSVIYDPYLRLICSTSDDRSIRLWKVTESQSSESNNINWQKAMIILIKTMFAHTARVWRAIIKNNNIVTIGEDSLMCIWSLSGNLLNKVHAHHGAPIWSIDISESYENIFTGGADGSVHIWPSAYCNSPKIMSLANNDICNIPKYVSYLISGTVLIFNEKGTLLCYNKDEMTLNCSLYLEKYRNYCIMQASPCRSFIAFASREGYVTICKEIVNMNARRLYQFIEERIMESQIFSLQWLRNETLIVCGANGLLKIFNFTLTGTIHVEAQCTLPPSRECWLTAALIYEELLVCGDRAGNIHIFQLNNVNELIKKPIQTISKVHGKIGVQSFAILKNKLITTGRDGMLRFYELNKDGKSLLTLHRKKMPMDWISGILKVEDSVFILGFKEVKFIMYDLSQERVLIRVPCGGGHRSWDCMALNEMVNFAYIRNKQVYIFNYPLKSLKLPILQNGFHIKETCCLQRLSRVSAQNIFVSGGEDCTFRIHCIADTCQNGFYTFHNLGIFDGHLSGIKCISIVKLNSKVDKLSSKHLVFSGGGRAQLKVWEINLKYNQNILPNIDLSCSDVKSHMLHEQDQYKKKSWQEASESYVIEPETRYMDIYAYYPSEDLNHILIFVACADGYLRLFVYDIKTSDIYLKVSTKYIDRCILKMYVLSTHKCKKIVLTMTTDGMLRFFDFTDIISEIYVAVNSKNCDILKFNDAPFAEFSLHQSGIDSFDLKIIDEDRYLLITGGDDNLLNLLCFKIFKNDTGLSVIILSKWSTASMHSTQITGLRFKDENQICSVGIDQRVILYNYSWCNGILSANVLNQIFTSVTDVQGMDLWSFDKNGSIVCIFGNGFEILSI